MSSTLATSGLVLAWCLLLSLLWANLCFVFVAYRPGSKVPKPTAATLGAGMILPALVAAPLTLLVGFKSLAVNLLFPLELFADGVDLLRAALAPAVVLVVASGLGSSLLRQVRGEYRHWEAQPFSQVGRALGKSTPRDLYKLVLTMALGTAWAQALPWLFGELVVVEAVFNAPGLGLRAWQMARERDHYGLLAAIGWLALLYAACTLFVAWSNRRLGKRLASYG